MHRSIGPVAMLRLKTPAPTPKIQRRMRRSEKTFWLPWEMGGGDGVEVTDNERDTELPDPVVECFTRLGGRVKRPKSSKSITHYFNTHFL